jgi:hypothetical protein
MELNETCGPVDGATLPRARATRPRWRVRRLALCTAAETKRLVPRLDSPLKPNVKWLIVQAYCLS